MGFARVVAATALPFIALCLLPGELLADPAIWANARHVKATYTECGQDRYVTFRGDAIKATAAPDRRGCRSTEVMYTQINISKALLGSRNGVFAEANVDAAYLSCEGPPPVAYQRGVLDLGTRGEVERVLRDNPPPPRCSYSRLKFQFVSSLGGIPFSDVPNGGTMSIKESLELHAKERAVAIAECNASAACRAEVQRQSAINAYYDCMKPLQAYEPARTCRRPW